MNRIIFAVAIGVLSVASVCAQPAMTLSDGANSITITSTGPTCTAGTCSTSAWSASSGNIVWSGSLGTFTIMSANGRTKPGLVDSVDLAIGTVTTGAAGGTLTVQWSDNGFLGSGTGSSFTFGGTILPGNAATSNYYVDNTNALFGTEIPLGSLTATSSASTSGTGTGPTADPFSMTIAETITLAANSFFSNDDSLQVGYQALSLGCSSASGQVGVPYSSTLAFAGGIPGYTFLLASGTLPNGLSLNPSTGLISGTPGMAGIFTFSAQVTDSVGNIATTPATSPSCSITVVPPNVPSLSVMCQGATVATEGVSFSSGLLASGGTPSYTYTLVGALPAGLNINAASGVISGVPTAAGTFTFTGKVVDSSKPSALMASTAASCSITVTAQTCHSITRGDTATIGFWHNKNGVALLYSLNGGGTTGSATGLGNLLAATFPRLWGAYATSPNINLAGKTNAQVSSFFNTLFAISGQKTYAQILAGALASYATNSYLAGGNYAASYGFSVVSSGAVSLAMPGAGTLGKTYNVGTNGKTIGLSNNTSYTLAQIFTQINTLLSSGALTSAQLNALNSIFSAINQAGDII